MVELNSIAYVLDYKFIIYHSGYPVQFVGILSFVLCCLIRLEDNIN